MYMHNGQAFEGYVGKYQDTKPQDIDYADMRIAYRMGWQPCEVPVLVEAPEVAPKVTAPK